MSMVDKKQVKFNFYKAFLRGEISEDIFKKALRIINLTLPADSDYLAMKCIELKYFDIVDENNEKIDFQKIAKTMISD